MPASEAVFFDIGDTLGSPRFSPPPHRLVGLDLFPFVIGVLQRLRDRGVRIGLISNTGHETMDDMRRVLTTAGIFGFLDESLLFFSSVTGLKKDSPEVFRRAAEKAGHVADPRLSVFVGEDNTERHFAMEAGLRVAAHPRLVFAVLDGQPLRFLRIAAPPAEADREWRRHLAELPLVPLHVGGEGGTTVHAIGPVAIVPTLVNLGFSVTPLAGDPQGSDLFLLRDDLRSRTGFLDPLGQSERFSGADADLLIASSEEGLFVALPAGRSVEEFHFEEAQHGHTQKLLPDFPTDWCDGTTSVGNDTVAT